MSPFCSAYHHPLPGHEPCPQGSSEGNDSVGRPHPPMLTPPLSLMLRSISSPSVSISNNCGALHLWPEKYFSFQLKHSPKSFDVAFHPRRVS